MTHILLLLVIEFNLHCWPSVSLWNNFEWPNRHKHPNKKKSGRAYQCFMSSLTSLSLKCRPINRLKANTVFCELTTACRLAGRPMRRSPCFVNATTEGVVRAPSEFSMTRELLPSMTETQEFVVPKSIPTTGPMKEVNI